MPNVRKGSRMVGLMAYLAGPGKRNEHEDPHIVGGSDYLMAWHADGPLTPSTAKEVAAFLDRPSRVFGQSGNEGHVWHCSLALAAREGELSDEKWGQIAEEFVAAMGFVDGAKAPCRWVAVRHGFSQSGGDHVHVVVDTVREDGTRASTLRDMPRSQQACRALEIRHGLEQLESVRAQRADRGIRPGELEAQSRRRAEAKHERTRQATGGMPAWEELSGRERQQRITAETDNPDRRRLERAVRGVLATSGDEATFVRGLRRAGLRPRPRFADHRQDRVVGYSVKAPSVHGEDTVFYGGGTLAKDLSLDRLRVHWGQDTVDSAEAAVSEWVAAHRNRRMVGSDVETGAPSEAAWQAAATDLAGLRNELTQIPHGDGETWASVARDTAGVFAAWSLATEPEPGDLAAAADALAVAARTHRQTVPTVVSRSKPLSAAATLLVSSTPDSTSRAGQALLLRELMRFSQALYQMEIAGERERQAQRLVADVRGRLQNIGLMSPALSSPVHAQGQAAQQRTAPVVEAQTAADPEALRRAVDAGQLSPQVAEMLTKLETFVPSAGRDLVPPTLDERPRVHAQPVVDNQIER